MDRRILGGQSIRAKYLHLTDRLIWTTTNGGFDRVLFLDKSARPVCWLMREAWAALSPDFDRPGSSGRLPRCTFLNIDRLQWRELLDPEGVGRFDASRLPSAPLDGLNRCFRPRAASPQTWLDRERVLIVDEVRVSGDTALIAERLLARAFPHASFGAFQWMTPKLVSSSRVPRREQHPAGRVARGTRSRSGPI